MGCSRVPVPPARMMPFINARPASPVVRELEGDAEVAFAQQSDDRLQVVALLARDPQLVALDLRLDALEAGVADSLRDHLRLVRRDSLLKGAADHVLLSGLARLGG